MEKKDILSLLNNIPGKKSFYYKNLVTSEEIKINENEPLKAASIIKLPIMMVLFKKFKEGTLHAYDTYSLKEKDKKPSCGCLNMMHSGLELTLLDLCSLMIILSDNSAANILIDIIGIKEINQAVSELGYKSIKLNRYLFDREASEKGIENYVCASEICNIYEKLYKGILIDKKSDDIMINILKEQRLNGKFPFYFKEKTDIAHKTGEDEGITHDTGIIYSRKPFILCCLGNEVETPDYERFMQETAWKLHLENNKPE